MPIDGAGLPARVIRPRLAGGGARRAGVRNGRTRNGAPRLIGGDMDKSADERGNTGPTDGIKTKGDAGTLDAKLIITRRILWWIGLVLLLPFTLNLVHFDGPYLMLERILCAIPPKLASDPSSIVGLPLLEAEFSRIFDTGTGHSLLVCGWNNEISRNQPLESWKEDLGCTYLRRNHHHHRIDSHGYYRILPRTGTPYVAAFHSSTRRILSRR